MKKFTLRECLAIVAIVGLVGLAQVVLAGESKYAAATTATDPGVTFASQKTVPLKVKAANYSTDTSLGALTYYQRTTASPYYPTTAATSGATVVWAANTGIAMTNGDHVVYQHSNGTVLKTTVASATATNVTLATGLTLAGATGDRLYDLEIGWVQVVGENLTAAGTNKVGTTTGDPLYVTRNDSPLYVQVNSETNSSVGVTIGE